MKARKRQGLFFLLTLISLMFPVFAFSGQPVVENVMVTDVTTVSFSVIWTASEASSADLKVYADIDGITLLEGVDIISHPTSSGDPAIKIAAEDNGVMKVRVTGLEANATYYFMTITTSKSTNDTTNFPAAAPFMPVTTESETVRTYESSGDVLPFSNDIIIEECYLDDGTTPAEGTLLLATLEGGKHPVTVFVGDGVDSPYALIDLNNVFSNDNGQNLDLFQSENLTLINFRGFLGNSIVTHSVPLDESLSEIKDPAYSLKVGWNMISFQLEPAATDVETVLAPIMDKVSSIWAYDATEEKWLRYDKYGPSFLNDLSDLHAFEGYWIKLEDDVSLKINGDFLADPVALNEGWNMVGYRSIETLRLMDVIDPAGSADPLINRLNSVWTYDTTDGKWLRYDKNGPSFLNDLLEIKPGRAYWVDMDEADVW